MGTIPSSVGGIGRPSAATPQQVLEAARQQFRAGKRLDVRGIATELGLGRATIYRWFASREDILNAVLGEEVNELTARAIQRTTRTGADGLLELVDSFNQMLVKSTAFRAFLQQEPATAMALVTSRSGPVRPKVVAALLEQINRSIAEDGYMPTAEPSKLAYALVRLAEAFLYDDAFSGIRDDLDSFHDVAAALLGVPDWQR
ncbi:QsdR family transcriptional regulator [Rhodococcus koreensis]